MDRRDFDKILKEMSYQEWRQRKILKKYELPTDPHSAIWNFIDNEGRLLCTENEVIYQSSDQILDQIEHNQSVLQITFKRRSLVKSSSDEFIIFTEKIEKISNEIINLNKKLEEMHSAHD